MSVDIETYSDISIKEVGHFRYIDSPAFQVLLIALSYPDTKEVTVISPIEGEVLPEELKRALFDESITKHAFNASFEWYALSKHFGLIAREMDRKIERLKLRLDDKEKERI